MLVLRHDPVDLFKLVHMLPELADSSDLSWILCWLPSTKSWLTTAWYCWRGTIGAEIERPDLQSSRPTFVATARGRSATKADGYFPRTAQWNLCALRDAAFTV